MVTQMTMFQPLAPRFMTMVTIQKTRIYSFGGVPS